MSSACCVRARSWSIKRSNPPLRCRRHRRRRCSIMSMPRCLPHCSRSAKLRCASPGRPEGAMAEVNLVEAINLALAYEMAHDPSVVLLGEDIGANGGVFRATAGLQTRFGAQRVLDTPLAETAIAGLAIGMAAGSQGTHFRNR